VFLGAKACRSSLYRLGLRDLFGADLAPSLRLRRDLGVVQLGQLGLRCRELLPVVLDRRLQLARLRG